MWGKARAYGAISWGVVHLFLGFFLQFLGFSAMFILHFLLGSLFLVSNHYTLPQHTSDDPLSSDDEAGHARSTSRASSNKDGGAVT